MNRIFSSSVAITKGKAELFSVIIKRFNLMLIYCSKYLSFNLKINSKSVLSERKLILVIKGITPKWIIPNTNMNICLVDCFIIILKHNAVLYRKILFSELHVIYYSYLLHLYSFIQSFKLEYFPVRLMYLIFHN